MVNSSLAADFVWISTIDDLTKTNWTRTDTLALNLETPVNIGDRYAQKLRGWFVAPATTRYKFYMACDDACKLSMNLVADKIDTKTELININSESNFRDYWKVSDN